MKLIKISNGSITMMVVKEDLSFYKRAGYSEVEEPVVEVEDQDLNEPEKPKQTKRVPGKKSADQE